MTLYVNTSALVKLYVPEPGSELTAAEANAASILTTALRRQIESRHT